MSTKRKNLEKMGGREMTVQEFLGLSEAENAILELRLELTDAIRKGRAARGLTQAELAKAAGTTQSRVAKMESGDPHASIELLLRVVAALGGRPKLVVHLPAAKKAARAKVA